MNEQHISLDGVWEFQIDPSDGWDAAQITEWRAAAVPMPWQAQFDDLRLAGGVAWYRRRFTLFAHELGQAGERAALLHFGAVNYHAAVWLNGALLGAHEGGYLPFEFDVTPHLRDGENELLVRVADPDDDRARFPGYPFSEIPHGKQSWYGPIGGIWQSVRLDLRPRAHIRNLALHPSPADGTIGVTATLSGAAGGDVELLCTVTDASGVEVGSVLLEGATAGEITGEIAGEIAGTVQIGGPPHLWSTGTPYLYTVAAALYVDGAPVHAVSKCCGFRTVEARDGRIYLNGAPVYLRGVLDQGYFPETIYTPPSLELLEEQARAIKELGFNCLRIHIKVEDPRYYDVADRLGLLVWTEIPNWALLTEAASARARETLRGMVARDGHHPSIIAWTLVNENWGTDLARNPEHRRWLADFYREAKALDPTRLVVDNSACCDNLHVAGDLDDFHHYRAIPDHAREWDAWVADFAARADWAWAADYAEHRRPGLPLVVSEFGNWGLPDPDEIQERGGEPWWFETGHNWGEGIVYPHGVQERYAACGLGDLYPSFAAFARDSQAHMARSLHYEISTMRLHDTVAGYVVTEATDVHWECNGLLTMQRKPKHLLDPLLEQVNQDNVVVLRPERWSARPGDILHVAVYTAGVDGGDSRGRVLWAADGQSGAVDAGSGAIAVVLNEAGVVPLTARWVGDDGTLLAANRIDLVCVAAPPVAARLWVADSAPLAGALRDLGYSVSDGGAGPAQADVVVAMRYTRALEAHVQGGGRLILLADPAGASAGESVPLPIGGVVPRAGTAWQGDWANSFVWLKKQGPFAHLPGSPLLAMEWAGIMPDAVLAGKGVEAPWVLRDHSWAGLAVGWVHKAVTLLIAAPYGRGRFLVTTFKLNAETLATDAVAQALFAGLVNLIGE